MSFSVICPSCNEKNPGHVYNCVKCNANLIGVSRQEDPLTEVDIAARQKATLNKKIALVEEKVKTENIFKGSASNFHWIAGLSLVNSIIQLMGGNWSFFFGLGITQLIDGISRALAHNIGGNASTIIQIVAFLLNVSIAGIFVMFGVFAQKQQKWAFIVGMILYALDGLLFLIVSDFLNIGFHIFILFGLYSGMKSINKYREVQQQISA